MMLIYDESKMTETAPVAITTSEDQVVTIREDLSYVKMADIVADIIHNNHGIVRWEFTEDYQRPHNYSDMLNVAVDDTITAIDSTSIRVNIVPTIDYRQTSTYITRSAYMYINFDVCMLMDSLASTYVWNRSEIFCTRLIRRLLNIPHRKYNGCDNFRNIDFVFVNDTAPKECTKFGPGIIYTDEGSQYVAAYIRLPGDSVDDVQQALLSSQSILRYCNATISAYIDDVTIFRVD